MVQDSSPGFYVTGGTLRQDAPCYIERQADKDLYEGLLRGEFCYVLSSRQMGKSSLMVHTAAQLREHGVAVVILDLAAMGQHVTVEQWYSGLLEHLGWQLDLEDALEEYWLSHSRRAPLARWMAAIREVVLPRLGVRGQGSETRPDSSALTPDPQPLTPAKTLTPDPYRLVIFIDEIDAIRSLPFSTDEFFAAIRECYNRRAQDPAYQRLVFCLLGVATPADLIRDTRISPFNIGRRIQLQDFTAAEAALLARGLDSAGPVGRKDGSGTGRELLERVLYWTRGQPYLTQRLCRAIAEEGARPKAPAPASGYPPARPEEAGLTPSSSPPTPAAHPPALLPPTLSDVDRLCEDLFLTHQAQEVDDNLAFVRSRLLRSEVDVASLLDLYLQVQQGKRVSDDETNVLVSVLRLSGVVRAAKGKLQVRNRIYARVFDRDWVTQHMPDAELRRQRTAYLRGIVRAAAVSGVILAIMGGLVSTAVDQARHANQQRRLAEERERVGRRYLYAADLNLAQQAWEKGNTGRAQALLEAQRPGPGQEELRGFDWRYLWHLCRSQERFSLYAHAGPVGPVAFSPDGKLVAAGGSDLTLWDLRSRRPVAALKGHTAWVGAVAFSLDGRALASGSDDHTVMLWDVRSHRALATLKGHSHHVQSVAFSPDGRILASGSWDKTIRLWAVALKRGDQRPRCIATLRGHSDFVQSLAFSPDGRRLASGSVDTTVKLWDLATRRVVATLQGGGGPVGPLAISPDGKVLAFGDMHNAVQLWAFGAPLRAGSAAGYPAELGVGGGTKQAAPAGWRRVALLKGHADWISSLAFSPDGKTLASSSGDSTIRLWNVRGSPTSGWMSGRECRVLKGHKGVIYSVAFSTDGKSLASGGADKTIKLWDAVPGPDGTTLPVSKPVISVAFSPDGRTLATGDGTGRVMLWDLARHQEVATLRGHNDWVGAVVFSPDGRFLATGSNDRTVRLWELTLARSAVDRRREAKGFSPAKGRPSDTAVFAGLTPHGPRLTPEEVARLPGYTHWLRDLAFSPDGKILATGSDDKAVRLWEVPTGWPLAALTGHAGAVGGLAFSPVENTLASWSTDNTVKLWTVSEPHPAVGAGRRPPLTWKEVASLKGWPELTPPLVFSPDGRTLATNSTDGTIELWSVARKRKIAALKGHTGAAVNFAFSPDGKVLASSTANNAITLWNLTAGQEVATLKGHQGPVYPLVFSPDGDTLASGAGDGTVRLWHAASFRETDPVRLVLSAAGDRQVQLQWEPLPWAVGYNVYRASGVQVFRSSGVQGVGVPTTEHLKPRTPEHLNTRTPEVLPGFVKLNRRAVTALSFTDPPAARVPGPSLVNGRPQTYGVAPVFLSSAGQVRVGPAVTLQATPVAVPGGFVGCSINEGPDCYGSAFCKAATGAITLRGAGEDVWEAADGCYFLNRPVVGDFRATVKLLTRPTETDEWAKAGLMLRESMGAGARNAYLACTAAHGLQFNWRATTDGTAEGIRDVISNAALAVPITLRLTRQGDTVIPEYSRDDGRTFHPAGAPYQFEPALAETVSVGLAITSHNRGALSEARFRGLQIQPR